MDFVESLVRGLRLYQLCCMAKKEKQQKRNGKLFSKVLVPFFSFLILTSHVLEFYLLYSLIKFGMVSLFFVLATLCGMQDLSSLTEPCAPCSGMTEF